MRKMVKKGENNMGSVPIFCPSPYFVHILSELQRFISEDPIGLAGGINQYVYVENNPVSWIDPEGLASSGRSGRRSGGKSRERSGGKKDCPIEINPYDKNKDAVDKIGDLLDGLPDPDCVYRPVRKCVKINCNADVDDPYEGPWLVKDINKSCWCQEWKVVLECR